MRRLVVAALLLALAPLSACSSDEDAKPAEPDDQAALISAVNEALEVDPAHDNLRAVLVQVDGMGSIDEVEARIGAALDEVAAKN